MSDKEFLKKLNTWDDFYFKLGNDVWNIKTLLTQDEMKELYCGRTKEDVDYVFGFTDYHLKKIYLDCEPCNLIKTLRHELLHAYIWEYTARHETYSEEELCNIYSCAAPIIEKVVKDYEDNREKHSTHNL